MFISPHAEFRCTLQAGFDREYADPRALTVMDQGAEAVSLASTQAMVDAHKKSQEAMMTKMSALYSGAGVPMPPPQ